jgi:molybdate transport system substrate-binding protein
MRTAMALALVSSLPLASCAKRASDAPVEIVVAAAASLRGVLPEIIVSYRKTHTHTRVTATFGASGELRQQVEAGAPIDLVAFAGAKLVDDLIARGWADVSTRRVIATNTLVLIGPRRGRRFTFSTLASAGRDEKIAIGDPRSVPAGQYARALLEEQHEWDALQGKLVYGDDVSAVLAYARRGEVVAAIVYKTELHGVTDVEILDELPPALDPRPELVVARMKGSRAKEAADDFLAYLESDETRRDLSSYGFGAP